MKQSRVAKESGAEFLNRSTKNRKNGKTRQPQGRKHAANYYGKPRRKRFL